MAGRSPFITLNNGVNMPACRARRFFHGAASTHTRFQEAFSMTTWLKDELRKLAETDDLHISPFRENGVTYVKNCPGQRTAHSVLTTTQSVGNSIPAMAVVCRGKLATTIH
jgi:hypothetical protein